MTLPNETPSANETSSTPTETTVTAKRKRGFAAMDPAIVREIARKGGVAAHQAGTAHEFTSEKAREAGSIGGRASHAKRKASKAVSELPNVAATPDDAPKVAE